MGCFRFTFAVLVFIAAAHAQTVAGVVRGVIADPGGAQVPGATVTLTSQETGVRGVEKCFARKTGLRYHVDLHLEVDPEITVRQSHEIAHNVRYRVREQLDWVADVLVHVEPAP